jgi:DNA polymerase-3 subunit alpha
MSENINNESIGYVSLHNHTSFSILDSLIEVKDLFIKTKELGQTAVAITDHGTMGAMWGALQASKDTGVKLIAGCEHYFVDDLSNTDARLSHFILLAKNAKGYENLLKLTAEGYDNYIVSFKRSIPRVDWSILEKYSEGLICTTACANGILGQLINQKKFDEAISRAKRLKDIFADDFAIELQPHALKRTQNAYSGEIDQISTNKRLRKIAEELDIKCIVATNAHYIEKEHKEAHDVLLAISAGAPVKSGMRLQYEGADLHMKSETEVLEKLARISYDRDFAIECIKNTKYFADKCEFPDWIDPKFSNPSGKELPSFPVKDQSDYNEFLNWMEGKSNLENKEEDECYLRYLCEINLAKKIPKADHKQYLERLEEELDVLEYHKFSSYMLIVCDYLAWARLNNYQVGYGRGSVGGSLVAYLIDIHVANPIKYGLIFARFHNKQKKSFPDIDSDFCSSGKEAVTEYIKQKYGKDQVASVTNMNRMTPKVYVKSIARSFVYGGDRKTAVQVGNALADTIPADIPNMRLAFENAALFNEYTKPISEGGAGYTEVKKYHEHIAGKLAALSTHAGGLIIGKRSLKGLIPLRKDKEGNVSIEFEKNGAEELGLVKMDILGVKTLEIVRKTHELIKETTGNNISYPDFEEYDEKTYKLLGDGNTFCVFQLGTSDGTIDLCQKIKPKCLEDISIINSLARPSSRDIRSELIATRNGEREVKILHESLNAAFKPTFGFGLYEESLLQLARDVAGWDYHEADKLRKLTKEKGKNPEKVKQWRQEFIDDSVNNNIPKNIATRIWDETISAFSGYGFNKSHSILYSILSYHTAWLKAHYPLQFLVCNLQSEIEANSKDSKVNIAKIKEEIRSLGVNILPPDVNKSDISYKIIDKDTILTGLDALKFMGKDAIPNIIENRPYSNFDEFLTKINGRSVNIRSIQALVASGCLGSFGLSRKLMYLYSADYKKKLQAFTVNNKKNPEKYPSFSYPWPEMDDWTLAEKCALEKFYLGESLSGNKIKQFNGFFTGGAPSFKNLVRLLPRPTANVTESQLRKYNKKVTLLQGEITNIREFKIKKEDSKMLGQLMAKLTVEDPFGNNIIVTFFPDSWVAFQNRFRNLSSNKFKLEVGCGMYFNGNLNWYNDELSIIYDDLVKVCSVPPLPKDLESKKISLKKEPKLKKPSEEDLDRNVLLEELENELINSGNTDLDDDD